MRERSEIENQIKEVRQNYGVRLNYENLLKELQIELLLDVRELLNNNQSLQNTFELQSVMIANNKTYEDIERSRQQVQNGEGREEPPISKEIKKVLNKELEKDRKNHTSKKGNKKK